MSWKIWLVAALIIAADRISKEHVVEVMNLRNLLSIDVYDPYFNLRMAWNEGVNFGLFNFGQDGRWVLIGLSALIVLAVLIWTRRARGWLTGSAVGLIVGGALGNIWDRITYGAVADFINMSCCGIQNPFSFNIADTAIFLGAFILILWGEQAMKDGRA